MNTIPISRDAVEQALLPCPFCGGLPKTTERPDNINGTEFFFAVACYCGGYSATAHKMAVRKTPEQAKRDAVDAWNTRAALAQADQPAVPQAQAGEPEAIQELCADCNGTGFVWRRDSYGQFEPKPCKECGETGRVTALADKGPVVGTVSWPIQPGACPNVIWEHTPPAVSDGEQLIPLQAHREAISQLQSELAVVRELEARAIKAMAELEENAGRVSKYHYERTLQLAKANEALAKKDAALVGCVEALRIAITQNGHDMLMTGEEQRIAIAAITQAQGVLG